MKKMLLPLALFAMAVVIGAAVAVDCVRLAADYRHRVELADDEMRNHEDRLVELLSGSPLLTPEVGKVIQAHSSADDRAARREAYDHLVTQFQQTMSAAADPTDPLARRFMDDAAGAINRREIANQTFARESAAYQEYLASWRGTVAETFSAAAREDGPGR